MFDFDASKLLIVGAIALIFIPPKDLPRVLRQVGQFVGKMRRMASEFQGQFMDAMREADLADLRQEARKLADAAKVDVGLDAVADLKSHLTGAIEGKPLTTDATSSPVDPVPSVDAGAEPHEAAGPDHVARTASPVVVEPTSDRVHVEAAHPIETTEREHRGKPVAEASIVSSPV